MSTVRAFLALPFCLLLAACAGPAPAPGTAGSAPTAAAAPAAAAPTPPDPARVYADLLGRSEDVARVLRAPKDFDGRSVVFYGVRGGDLRGVDGKFSLPLATPDGRTAIAATERPVANQLYLVLTDDFAREARERRLLTGGAARGPIFVECRVTAQTTTRVTTYPCDVEKLVVIANDRVAESLTRGRNGALEYYRY